MKNQKLYSFEKEEVSTGTKNQKSLILKDLGKSKIFSLLISYKIYHAKDADAKHKVNKALKSYGIYADSINSVEDIDENFLKANEIHINKNDIKQLDKEEKTSVKKSIKTEARSDVKKQEEIKVKKEEAEKQLKSENQKLLYSVDKLKSIKKVKEKKLSERDEFFKKFKSKAKEDINLNLDKYNLDSIFKETEGFKKYIKLDLESSNKFDKLVKVFRPNYEKLSQEYIIINNHYKLCELPYKDLIDKINKLENDIQYFSYKLGLLIPGSEYSPENISNFNSLSMDDIKLCTMLAGTYTIKKGGESSENESHYFSKYFVKRMLLDRKNEESESHYNKDQQLGNDLKKKSDILQGKIITEDKDLNQDFSGSDEDLSQDCSHYDESEQLGNDLKKKSDILQGKMITEDKDSNQAFLGSDEDLSQDCSHYDESEQLGHVQHSCEDIQ